VDASLSCGYKARRYNRLLSLADAQHKGEVHLIERTFGLDADMLSEVFELHCAEIEEWAAWKTPLKQTSNSKHYLQQGRKHD
jgi:hypothetical protein